MNIFLAWGSLIAHVLAALVALYRIVFVDGSSASNILILLVAFAGFGLCFVLIRRAGAFFHALDKVSNCVTGEQRDAAIRSATDPFERALRLVETIVAHYQGTTCTLEAGLNALPLAVCIVDNRDAILFANAEATKLPGLSASKTKLDRTELFYSGKQYQAQLECGLRTLRPVLIQLGEGKEAGHALRVIVVQDVSAVVESEEHVAAMEKTLAALHLVMKAACVKVEESAEKVAGRVAEVSGLSVEQRKRMTENATAMEEMSATILEVAKSSGQAAKDTLSAKEKAEAGAQVVTRASQATAEVYRYASELKVSMAGLGEHIQSIGQIMNVISDIADQTNLLALNAAIEAARAGEAGRGFAVVADEVRKLAEKTVSATQDVGKVIESIQTNGRQNIESVDKVAALADEASRLSSGSGEMISGIAEIVEAASMEVHSIAVASEEQSVASREIAENIERVHQTAEDIATYMDRLALTVTEMVSQAERLKRSSAAHEAGDLTPLIASGPVLNCWEHKKCGRQPGGAKVAEFGVCPAAQAAPLEGLNRGKKGGRGCWAVPGTFCGGKIQGSFTQKMAHCMKCDFFQRVRSEEAEKLVDSEAILNLFSRGK